MRGISLIASSIFLLSCAFIGAAFFLFTTTWIDVSMLERYNPGRPTIVLDDEGNEWTRFALDRREPIALTQLPQHLIEAFLSAEDWGFFSHCGISWRGIVRSTIINLYHGRKAQGASTITQQLVKLLFFDGSKTFSRKLKEQLYALIIEQQFTKHQILEIYLNHVYFGCGIYGVEAAAQRFWGISAAHVSIAQSATLAGIICNPAHYCPLLHPLSCEYRRNVILASMLKRNIITSEMYDTAKNESLNIMQSSQKICGAYVKEMTRQSLEDLVGKQELYSGGLTVQVTLNQKLQYHAQDIFQKQITKLRHDLNEEIEGAVIAFEVQTGEIKALIGGSNFSRSSFNRAIQARRQFGSIFKPVVYAAAMEHGLQFKDVVLDEPIELYQGTALWSPQNWDHTFRGPITRAFALSHSNNIVAIKTLLEIGAHTVINVAKRCHLPGPYFPYPSLALGCIDGTLKHAAAMFNIFANDGIYIEPHCIRWIKDRWGTKIYKKEVMQERIFTRDVVGKVAKVLMHGLKRIRKWFVEWFDSEAIGKTGTTNDSRTCWFIGSTPRLTTAVYIGNDDNRSLGHNVYPVRTAFPIWLAVTQFIAKAGERFTFDPTLQLQIINDKTGEPCQPNDPEAIEIFV
jgi:penicillin-binding protein 1A